MSMIDRIALLELEDGAGHPDPSHVIPRGVGTLGCRVVGTLCIAVNADLVGCRELTSDGGRLLWWNTTQSYRRG
jgi:hypothetical protein